MIGFLFDSASLVVQMIVGCIVLVILIAVLVCLVAAGSYGLGRWMIWWDDRKYQMWLATQKDKEDRNPCNM